MKTFDYKRGGFDGMRTTNKLGLAWNKCAIMIDTFGYHKLRNSFNHNLTPNMYRIRNEYINQYIKNINE